jgi:hypothetical protein
VRAGEAGRPAAGPCGELLGDDQIDGHDDLVLDTRSGESCLPDAWLAGQGEASAFHGLAERWDRSEPGGVEDHVGVGG